MADYSQELVAALEQVSAKQFAANAAILALFGHEQVVVDVLAKRARRTIDRVIAEDEQRQADLNLSHWGTPFVVPKYWGISRKPLADDARTREQWLALLILKARRLL